ncbi:MAG: GtrA family protein, partial [Clostridia bacterium]|nr:GtrA family protein [Clostridia bacterium]
MLSKIKELIKKYREPIAYLIFGGLTTLISWGVSNGLYYFAFNKTNNLLANVISEVVAITFAYVTNKLFVFCSKTNGFKQFITEMALFYGARIASTLLNLGAMWLFVDKLLYEFWICKIVINVVVIVLNYFLSKLFIFKGKNTKK